MLNLLFCIPLHLCDSYISEVLLVGQGCWGAPEGMTWSHPEQVQHISAHASLVTVTAKNPHPPTVTGVAEAAGPDKVLPVLSDLPTLTFSHWPPFSHSRYPSPCSLCLCSAVRGCRWGLCKANWSVGFGRLEGRQHNHTSYQTEPTLIRQRRNSQLPLGSQ